MLETVNDLIKIPALKAVQMLAPLQYVFALNNVSVRTRIAEIVRRDGRGHPKVLEPFRTSKLPAAYRPVAPPQEVN